eukprot:464173_1
MNYMSSFRNMSHKNQIIFVALLSFATHCICRPTVGVIRWDAWNQVNDQYDEISYFVQNDMSPPQFHYRLPFFATTSPNVSFNNDNQTVMDKEIQYAHTAGIDYWAFDMYCPFKPNCVTSSPYCAQYANQTQCCRYCPEKPAYGLDLYLTSQYKHLINFTLLLLGSIPCNPTNIDYYVSLLKEPTYQTVTINNTVRPLIYLFMFHQNEVNFCGGWNKSKQAFDNIRTAVMNAGINNPYFVYMSQGINQAYEYADKLGFDAMSCYNVGAQGTVNGSAFNVLAQTNADWWNNAYKGSDNEYSVKKGIMNIQTGWDPRPRYENPPPWIRQGPAYFLQPTTDELQSLILNAVNFTCKYSDFIEAQTMIIYAWNECTENGACIMPTLGNGTKYVDAMSKILPASC